MEKYLGELHCLSQEDHEPHNWEVEEEDNFSTYVDKYHCPGGKYEITVEELRAKLLGAYYC